MAEGTLFVADYRADRFGLLPLDVPRMSDQVHSLTTCPQGGRGTLAEHAGLLRLPAGAPDGLRWAFVDDLRGALVLGDADGERIRYPSPTPAEHLAVDPAGRIILSTTGCGADFEPFSELFGWCDIATGETRTGRLRTGEPGVAIAGGAASYPSPVAAFRHRNPGEIFATELDTLAEIGPHTPRLTLPHSAEIADDGHGDAIDPTTGHFVISTTRGLEVVDLTGSSPRLVDILQWPIPGRAYYLRADHVSARIIAAVRGGPSDARLWPQWQNWLVSVDITSRRWDITAISPGLAFRPDLDHGEIACAVIHPDGDTLWRWNPEVRDGGSDEAAAYPLTAMADPPQLGREPWDSTPQRPAQRRGVAHLGTAVAVSRGGDGIIDLFHDNGERQSIALDSPLDEGGTLAWIPPQAPVTLDRIGR